MADLLTRSTSSRSRDSRANDMTAALPATPALVRKLHLGCGAKYIPGFYHVDIVAGPHIDRSGQVDDLAFLPDGMVELIYACHVLEHFGRYEVGAVLREWHRVLRAGGVLRLSVPDFAAVVKMYASEGLGDGMSGLVGLVSGGQRTPYDYHKMIFDEPLLTTLLRRVGFAAVQPWDWRHTEHAHIDDYSQAYLPHLDKERGQLMSLNLEAVKG